MRDRALIASFGHAWMAYVWHGASDEVDEEGGLKVTQDMPMVVLQRVLHRPIRHIKVSPSLTLVFTGELFSACASVLHEKLKRPHAPAAIVHALQSESPHPQGRGDCDTAVHG